MAHYSLQLSKVAGFLCAVVLLVGAEFVAEFVYRLEHNDYIMPPGFNGPAMIVFSHPGGRTPSRNGALNVYRIPDDGILYLSTPSSKGWEQARYFVETTGGTPAELPRSADASTLQVYFSKSGVRQSPSARDLHWKGFVVGVPRDLMLTWDDAYDELLERAKEARRLAQESESTRER